VKVLVTGATGFVGSHVVDVLLERGHEVFYIARKTSNFRWLEGKSATRVDGSLFDVNSLRPAVEGMDVVIHVAGLTAAKNEAEFLKGNRDATQNLLDAIRAYAPSLRRYVHISSLAVCGPAVQLDEPITEESPLKPITAYGRTKKLAEQCVTACSDIPWTIVRPPAVYGPRDEAILTFFQTINKGLASFIGFDEKRVSLVHVRDLARGIVDAAFADVAVGQTYFISSDETYTWDQISAVTASIMGKRKLLRLRLPHSVVLSIAGTVGFFGKLAGKPPVLDYEKGIDLTQKYWICSTTKARRELGYRQEMSLADGIRDTVEWYRGASWL
jgi:nucleoside-diphosphate-sugar epimerase